MDDESKKWWGELGEGFKIPNVEVRECCLIVVLGDLGSLACDVHREIGNLKFDFNHKLIVNYCPMCGKELKEYKEKVYEKLKKALYPSALEDVEDPASQWGFDFL